MTRQVVLRHGSSTHRRQPLLSASKSSSYLSSSSSSARSRRLGEVAGGTAAEITAICCCCPCTVLNILFLAVYKLPAGLFRRAFCRHRHKGISQPRCSKMTGVRDELPVKTLQWDTDVMHLEKEMWDQFDGTGFWRSPSQREKPLETRHVA